MNDDLFAPGSVVAWEWVSPDERAVAFPVQAVREALAVLGIEVPE